VLTEVPDLRSADFTDQESGRRDNRQAWSDLVREARDDDNRNFDAVVIYWNRLDFRQAKLGEGPVVRRAEEEWDRVAGPPRSDRPRRLVLRRS
jgi:hypothetical protein